MDKQIRKEILIPDYDLLKIDIYFRNMYCHVIYYAICVILCYTELYWSTVHYTVRYSGVSEKTQNFPKVFRSDDYT